jgi:hypothetical protein
MAPNQGEIRPSLKAQKVLFCGRRRLKGGLGEGTCPVTRLIRTLTEKSRGHEPIGFNRGATNGEIPKETDNKNDGPRGTKCRNGDVARNDGQNVRSRQQQEEPGNPPFKSSRTNREDYGRSDSQERHCPNAGIFPIRPLHWPNIPPRLANRGDTVK